MPSHRVLYATLLLSACATTGTLGIDPQSSQRARVSFEPVAADTTQLTPQAIDPQLPSADRLARVIDSELGEHASVDVRMCVTPGGQVSTVKVERSSTLAAFDDAVVADVAQWRFATQPGPDTLKTCELATIVYRPHR